MAAVGPSPEDEPREALRHSFKMCAMSFGVIKVQAQKCGFFSLAKPLNDIRNEGRIILKEMRALGPVAQWSDQQVADLYRTYEQLQGLLIRSHRMLHEKLRDCAFLSHQRVSAPLPLEDQALAAAPPPLGQDGNMSDDNASEFPAAYAAAHAAEGGRRDRDAAGPY